MGRQGGQEEALGLQAINDWGWRMVMFLDVIKVQNCTVWLEKFHS
jgi:hypothetical protein